MFMVITYATHALCALLISYNINFVVAITEHGNFTAGFPIEF